MHDRPATRAQKKVLAADQPPDDEPRPRVGRMYQAVIETHPTLIRGGSACSENEPVLMTDELLERHEDKCRVLAMHNDAWNMGVLLVGTGTVRLNKGVVFKLEKSNLEEVRRTLHYPHGTYPKPVPLQVLSDTPEDVDFMQSEDVDFMQSVLESSECDTRRVEVVWDLEMTKFYRGTLDIHSCTIHFDDGQRCELKIWARNLDRIRLLHGNAIGYIDVCFLEMLLQRCEVKTGISVHKNTRELHNTT